MNEIKNCIQEAMYEAIRCNVLKMIKEEKEYEYLFEKGNEQLLEEVVSSLMVTLIKSALILDAS